MYNDVSYALRAMARHPGITAIVVLTLALGIGANTAVFSVVNAVLLRPLPYRDPDRLVTIAAQIPSMNIFGTFVEYNTYGEYWRAHSRSFQSTSTYTPGWVNLTSGSEPERVFMCRVNAGFLLMIGIQPEFGREFLLEEDQPGAPRVAMVSHSLWMRRFGGYRSLIGRPIDGRDHWLTVVGVTADLRQTSLADVPDMESYVPHTQSADAAMALVLRTSTDPMRLAPTLHTTYANRQGTAGF